jgi:carboxypeptidase C (cathepsin A)
MANILTCKIIFTACAYSVICVADCLFAASPVLEKLCPPQEQVSVTKHSIQLDGNTLNYTAIAGFLPILDESGKTEANMFFVAYIKEQQDVTSRPVTFAFNGGPGSSSVWLHLGCLGPKRVVLQKDAGSPPYMLIDNQYTWLDLSDIVFIDPIGTGFSYVADKSHEKDFFDVHKDIDSVGSFIRLFLTKYKRWSSPKYLVGESYGTLRAVGLLGYLPKEYGIKIDGVVLISSALNFEMISFKKGNDLPYVLYLPSYTAAAWYHKKLSWGLQADLPKALKEVRKWADNEYLVLLAKGDNLSAGEQSKLSDKLSAYTGLSPEFIRKNNFRINVFSFITELLADKRLQIGLMDSRVTGIAVPPGDNYEDPSFGAVRTTFVTALNDYLARNLDFNDVMPYKSLSMKVNSSWQWGSAAEGFVDFTDNLTKAIIANEKLKVFAAMGYYDLTTPFSTQEYTFDHLGLEPDYKKNIHYSYYHSGHQIYTSEDSLKKLKADIAVFFGDQMSR